MKKKGELKFTGFLIILAVIGYLLFIVNTTNTTQLTNDDAQVINSHKIDSIKTNPISNIYQKVSLENSKKKEALLNGQ